MAATPKQLLVVHPDMAKAMTAQVRRSLQRAGYVLLVGDASRVRVISVEYAASTDLLSRCAFEAIEERSGTGVRDTFAEKVLAALLAHSAGAP